jgi:hypothetical protein
MHAVATAHVTPKTNAHVFSKQTELTTCLKVPIAANLLAREEHRGRNRQQGQSTKLLSSAATQAFVIV